MSVMERVSVRRRLPSFDRVRARPAFAVAAAMIVVVLILAFLVPLLPSYNPLGQDLAKGSLGPFTDSAHLLGTDRLGRDTLSRLSLAMRTTIFIVVAALILNLVIGAVLGTIAGYYGRRTESAIMGLADLQLAIPVILLLIVVVAVIGSSPLTLAIVLGLSLWVGYARVARVITKQLREREFVLASITQGASNFRVITKHILPNVLPQLVILASFDTAVLVIVESSLSYLGLGIQPPTPSLGGMISEGQKSLQSDPWQALIPGIAIFFLIAGVQFMSQIFTAEGSRVTSKRSSAGGV